MRRVRAVALAALVGVACGGTAPATRVAADDDPFVACVGAGVEVARDDADAVVVSALAAAEPADVLRFVATADACGAWRFGDGVPAHVRAVARLGACGEACPRGWEAELVRAMRAAPAPTADDRCRRDVAADWRGWTIARLLDAPDLTPEAAVERARLLGRAGLGSADAHLEARLAGLAPDDAAALARRVLAVLPEAGEALRFRAAMALAPADPAEARRWLNQLAAHGRTAFRAFARAELARWQ